MFYIIVFVVVIGIGLAIKKGLKDDGHPAIGWFALLGSPFIASVTKYALGDYFSFYAVVIWLLMLVIYAGVILISLAISNAKLRREKNENEAYRAQAQQARIIASSVSADDSPDDLAEEEAALRAAAIAREEASAESE